MTILLEEDFSKAVRCPELAKAVPTITQLPPDVLAELWKKLPKSTLSKAKIFAAAVAVTTELLNQGKEPYVSTSSPKPRPASCR